MFFKDVIGQKTAKQWLVTEVKEGRIPHAQLICGPEGTGKLPLAIAYARYICCENRGEHDACGVCPTCVKFNKLVHPDLHFVFPVIKKKAGKDTVCDDFIADWRNFVLQNHYFNLNHWLKEMGAENINARTVSQKLGCSTQPVLYHFKTIEDVRIAAHKKASEFHIDYVTNLSGKYERPMLEVGMRHIQLAIEEKNIFRFLFHSNYNTDVSLFDWLTGENFDSLFPILKKQAKVDEQQAHIIFSQIFLVTHGIASLLANNAMVYDEAYCVNTLSNAYFGIMYLIKGGGLL